MKAKKLIYEMLFRERFLPLDKQRDLDSKIVRRDKQLRHILYRESNGNDGDVDREVE